MEDDPVAIEFVFHPEDAEGPSTGGDAFEFIADGIKTRLQNKYALAFPQIDLAREGFGSIRTVRVVLAKEAILTDSGFEPTRDEIRRRAAERSGKDTLIVLLVGNKVTPNEIHENLGVAPFGSISDGDTEEDLLNETARYIEHALKDRPTWMCVYNPENATTFGSRIKVGQKERWRIKGVALDELRRDMAIGDTVVVWRTIPKRDKKNPKLASGIVALAEVSDLPVFDETSKAEPLIEFKINEAFPEQPFPRDEFFPMLEGKDTSWPYQNALIRFDEVEERAFRSIFPPAPPPAGLDATSRVDYRSDEAEHAEDLLNRAPLAFTLAHKMNEIWGDQNKPPEKKEDAPRPPSLAWIKDKFRRTEEPERAAFTLHIDAPWGGGKTTFANFVSRFLNPEAFGFTARKMDELQDDPRSMFYKIKLGNANIWRPEYAQRKWITVPFNAWRHQHVSPPWWDLYEVIRAKCLHAQPWYKRCWMQAGEFLWRAFPPERRRSIYVFFGLSVIFFFLLTIDNPVTDIIKSFATEPETTPEATPTPEATATPATTAALEASSGNEEETPVWPVIVTALTGLSGLGVLTSFGKAIQEFVKSTGETINSTALGESDPLRRFRNHFAAMIKTSKQPVLVVVDDLDRCEPKYVVELVRGMLTVFQSPRLVFLLLGDRAWIETAFAKAYEDMKAAHAEDGITFGRRFVEKAIQVSFVLPKPDPEQRGEYLDKLLLDPGATSDDVPATNAETQPNPKNEGKDKQTNTDEADKPGEAAQTDAKEVVAQKDRTGEVVRAASNRKTLEDETRHVLSGLRDYLPDNPRRIKRLINTITLYQASAMTEMGARVRSDDWYRVITWVLLMSEYPEQWEALCSRPHLIERAKNAPGTDEAVETRDSTQGEDVPTDPDAKLLEKFADRQVQQLLKGEAFRYRKIPFSKADVEALARLTPVA